MELISGMYTKVGSLRLSTGIILDIITTMARDGMADIMADMMVDTISHALDNVGQIICRSFEINSRQ